MVFPETLRLRCARLVLRRKSRQLEPIAEEPVVYAERMLWPHSAEQACPG